MKFSTVPNFDPSLDLYSKPGTDIDFHFMQPANLGEHDASSSHLESASTVPDEWTGATEAQTPTSGLATREAEPIDQPMDGAHAASEVDVDAAMAASGHSQGASKAVPHPESPSEGWPSSTMAPVVAQ